ncbi:hypothetical protein GUITHDRAFT_75289 [Guillardia theta CCMP2712]|uniref:Eukaryotic translation initiation factor 5B n=1 Tax=Guillardia theta (strain CCMP2712) TaxID=905079 RepID=L1IX34_GUITC|nr:hypothetical protein GUITHDRAFT_75289 [Guillardia theta CCMP2712]EKX40813.1 hypothetical protein GUITHDRAFT_75289 [Guillardia theta CCMP2712]|eukprot:XP_005827793.1 hypothetical protein GUITHDRAFT_75289 [Guillardia theta CCMP2712]
MILFASLSSLTNLARLRSPILCVLGHVDTGKTKLLDKVRKTNVQEGEAGGITQQIGATFFPMTNLRKLTDQVSHSVKVDYKIPGLLVIDTPGHESFSNLRSRGTSICDICVLVVDIMHGLEPQTIESLQLLKRRRCPFLVALNKIDRCYDWQPNKDSPIQDTLAKQKSHTVREFESRWQGIKGEIASQGLNADLYYENKNPRKVVSVVPTSAITGEGVPDLLLLGIQLTQKMLVDRLMLSEALEATVLEVKVTEGFGTTLDIILVHGELHEGDTIVVCGMQGPIVTTIRTLLTPHPMKELRVKNEYVHHKSIEASMAVALPPVTSSLQAAMGVKIAASGLEGAVAGTSLLRLEKEDDIEELKSSVMEDLEELKKDVDKSGKGVHVQASTLGALEALLDFLHNSSIPVASINIGPVHKKDVIRASAMLERAPDLAMILAFDVKIVPEAEALAKKAGIKIFTANIIYHLFDQFKSFMEEKKAAKREQLYSNGVAVFPVILSIIPKNVFNKRNPIILGCEVKEGSLKVGTPLCIPELNFLEIGKVTSIQNNHKEVKVAKVGMSVAVKIEPSNDQQSHILYGRQFDHKVKLYSKITRDGIQAMKDHFAEEMTSEDWKLMSKLKQLFIRGVQHW